MFYTVLVSILLKMWTGIILHRISEGASKVTVLTYENGILKRLGQPLVSVSADEGLKQFVMFLA